MRVGESAAGAGGGGDGVRVAVLGVGACVLPCFVCGLSPRCGVTAVECDAEVGRRFFAADRVEQGAAAAAEVGWREGPDRGREAAKPIQLAR